MAKQYDSIDDAHRDFILRQHIFFTASAAANARVNCSPKPASALRVLGSDRVAYLDMTGSGNETAAHLLADGRLTFMFCAFEGPPKILRLYGRGRSLPRGSAEYAELLARAFDDEELPGSRQIVVLEVELVQSSCGFGVPTYDYVADRPTLARWAQTKSEDELEDYRRKKNARSIDGLPTSAA